jgi:SHS2 domain-containing protein
VPYRFTEEATADIAFEVWDTDLAGIFRDAGYAVIHTMIANPEEIALKEIRTIELSNEQLDLLLYNLLEQIIYYKDTDQLLLRLTDINILKENKQWRLIATAVGEVLDPLRHHQVVDVKAITLHDFRLFKTGTQWRAHVILDI